VAGLHFKSLIQPFSGFFFYCRQNVGASPCHAVKERKEEKRDKRLPEQQYQPQFYYKPIPSMSVPAAIQSSSIPVGFLCRLPSTERRLITRLEQSLAAAAPVVSSSRSALH
jgi:hypothetical protein